jgi:exodeoxyribonuclease VII large subunit
MENNLKIIEMAEQYEGNNVYLLSNVLKSLSNLVQRETPKNMYIKAEIASMNIYKNGHCHLDLVEKRAGKTAAEIRAIIFSWNVPKILYNFKEAGIELCAGMQVLFVASLTVDPVYGMSLVVSNVVPEYSLGEVARLRQNAIKRLQDENIINKNKQTRLALLPKKLALISVETSKGYSDFLNTIQNSKIPYAQTIQTQLFTSLLQGEIAAKQISQRIREISEFKNDFDAIVILRGGGGESGLSMAFDDYELAATIANSPLPVITGIGHSTNLTVADMTAFHAAITPTATAEFFLQKYENFVEDLQIFSKTITDSAKYIINNQQKNVQNYSNKVSLVSQNMLSNNRQNVDKKLQMLHFITQKLFMKEKNNLELFSEKIKLLDPVNILTKGYSITTKNGKLITSAKKIKSGDEIETTFADGKTKSIVK